MSKREGRNGKKKAAFNEGFTSKSKGHLNFYLDEEDFEDFKCGRLTELKCMKLFSDWASTRNAHFLGNPASDNILSSIDKTNVCEWLCKFASEA